MVTHASHTLGRWTAAAMGVKFRHRSESPNPEMYNKPIDVSGLSRRVVP